MPEIIASESLTQKIAALKGWQLSADKKSIRCEFKFKNFNACFGFMTRVAICAEKLDHHPNWSNSYNTLSITLSTHSAGGLTEKDIVLAQQINDLL